MTMNQMTKQRKNAGDHLRRKRDDARNGPHRRNAIPLPFGASGTLASITCFHQTISNVRASDNKESLKYATIVAMCCRPCHHSLCQDSLSDRKCSSVEDPSVSASQPSARSPSSRISVSVFFVRCNCASIKLISSAILFMFHAFCNCSFRVEERLRKS